METDLTDRAGNSRTSPCFEEEWTILTAQPVVPLDQLKTKATRHPALKLGAAFVLALVLGALTALLTISLRPMTEQSAETEVVPEQLIVAEAAPTPIEVRTTLERSEVEQEPALPKKIPVTVTLKSKTSSVPHRQPATPDSLSQDSSTEVEVQNSQQPVNRFEERRQRRVFRRQRRERAAAGRTRDLMRIDEIFEGRRP